jgi:hypothetical protein
MITTLVASKKFLRKHQPTLAMRLVIYFFEKFHQRASQENEEKPQTQNLKIAIF